MAVILFFPSKSPCEFSVLILLYRDNGWEFLLYPVSPSTVLSLFAVNFRKDSSLCSANHPFPCTHPLVKSQVSKQDPEVSSFRNSL